MCDVLNLNDEWATTPASGKKSWLDSNLASSVGIWNARTSVLITTFAAACQSYSLAVGVGVHLRHSAKGAGAA